MTLGNYPDMTLADARADAREARVKVDKGVDVGLEKRRAKLEAARANTFRQLAADYMERAGRALAPGNRDECQRYLDKDVFPRIGHLPACDVTGGDIVSLVEKVAERSDSVARRSFSLLGVIFAHGVAKHFIPNSPVSGLKLAAILGPMPTRRRRVKLTEAQIQELMRALPWLGRVNCLCIRILLATCVRKSELLLAKRSHVDLQNGLWTIPDENSKTKRGFVVPLAPIVIEWFRDLMMLKTKDDWLVPGVYGHLSRTALNNAIRRLEGFPHFSPHDLRSTARSYLTSSHVGVSLIVAERCLNHSLGGLVGVYDQHDYLSERRHALELWANFLAAAEKGKPSNVTALRAAA